MNTTEGVQVEYFVCDNKFNYKKLPAVIHKIIESVVSIKYFNEEGSSSVDEKVRNADFIQLGYPFWKHIAQPIPKEMFLHPES